MNQNSKRTINASLASSNIHLITLTNNIQKQCIHPGKKLYVGMELQKVCNLLLSYAHFFALLLS